MDRTIFRWIPAAVLCLLAAAGLFAWRLCFPSNVHIAHVPSGPLATPVPTHPVTVYLSNQSYQDPWIPVRLMVDDIEVLRTRLFVGRQHVRKTVHLQLPAGPHRLRAESTNGRVWDEIPIEVDGPRWITFLYWRKSETDGRWTVSSHAFPQGLD